MRYIPMSESLTPSIGLTLFGTQGWREDGSDAQQIDKNFTLLDACPVIVAKFDMSGAMAGYSNQALLTVSKSGVYRCSWYACITQAAAGGSPSSWLGGTSGFQAKYYPPSASPPQVTSPAAPLATGEYNVVGTALGSGVIVMACGAGTAVAFNFGYSSSGTTPMQYSIHVRLEYLDAIE